MRFVVPLLALLVVPVAAGLRPARVSAQEGGSPFTVDESLAKKGKSLFASKACNGCHTIGKGRLAGPDLAHVTERRSVEWITNWLTNTTQMMETDATAKALLAEFNNTKMPDFKLKTDDATALINYIASESKKVKPKEK